MRYVFFPNEIFPSRFSLSTFFPSSTLCTRFSLIEIIPNIREPWYIAKLILPNLTKLGLRCPNRGLLPPDPRRVSPSGTHVLNQGAAAPCTPACLI